MSSNLYKAMCFIFLVIVFVVAKLVKKSVYSLGVTIFCVGVLLILAIVFLVKYIKEKNADK